MADLTLEERYARAVVTPSDISEHLPTFLALVESLDAKTVIELGTRSGVSTVAWLYALVDRGTLWSVDIDERPNIGEHRHWVYLQGDDCDPDVLTQLPDSTDIVFLDTSHDYWQTAKELSVYRWLVRPGGVIVCHDTELAHPLDTTGPAYPVKRAITEFCAAEGLTWENDPKCWGLGTIHVG